MLALLRCFLLLRLPQTHFFATNTRISKSAIRFVNDSLRIWVVLCHNNATPVYPIIRDQSATRRKILANRSIFSEPVFFLVTLDKILWNTPKGLLIVIKALGLSLSVPPNLVVFTTIDLLAQALSCFKVDTVLFYRF